MSAYVMDPTEIGQLAAFAAWASPCHYDVVRELREDAGSDRRLIAMSLARGLMAANIDSVAHRYQEQEDAVYKAEMAEKAALAAEAAGWSKLKIHHLDIYELAARYDYQACELPDYDSTPAAVQVRQINRLCMSLLPRRATDAKPLLKLQPMR